jgi:Zn-dependent metalloprotease
VPGAPVLCAALNGCHAAGVCDPSTGACTNPAVVDGKVCEDGNDATANDACATGACGGTDLCAGVVCAAADQCHGAGTCDPATGLCSNPRLADGTVCDDGNPNTTGDVCSGGICGCGAGAEPCMVGRARADLESRRAALGFDANTSFLLVREEVDERGRSHVRWRQAYKGLRILGASAISHLDATGAVTDLTDAMLRNVVVDVTPTLSAVNAGDIAGVPPTSSELVIYPERQMVLAATGVPLSGTEEINAEDVAYVPLDFNGGSGFLLAWRLLDGTNEALVDAHQGTLIRGRDTSKSFTATGLTFYYGPQTLTCEIGDDVLRNDRFTVDDWETGTILINSDGTIGDSQPFTNPNSAVNRATAAADTLHGLEITWKMYHKVLGREGWDGDATPIDTFVHAPFAPNPCNAAFTPEWDGEKYLQFGDCNNLSVNTMDIVGHEFTHGVVYQTAELDESAEAGGLNEATGDVFGQMVKFYYHGGEGTMGKTIPNAPLADPAKEWESGDWKVGTKNPGGFRDMRRPLLLYWWAGLGKRDVHDQVGPVSRAFYFLAQGAEPSLDHPYSSPYLPWGMKGIGNTKATKIFYKALVDYMPEDASNFDYRHACWLAARELFPAQAGVPSREMDAVMNAFAAVNVGKVTNGYRALGWVNESANDTMASPQNLNSSFTNSPFDSLRKVGVHGSSSSSTDADYYRIDFACGARLRTRLIKGAGLPYVPAHYRMELYDASGVRLTVSDKGFLPWDHKGTPNPSNPNQPICNSGSPNPFYLKISPNGTPPSSGYGLIVQL